MSEVSLPAMQELQRLILRLNAGPDLAATLRAVVDGVVEGLGFGVAVVNLVHPDGTAEVVTVAGPPDVSATLLGTSSVVSTWQDEFDRAERWGALRYLAHTEPDNEAIASWVPDTPVSDEPDAWHPMDALFAPMYSVAGTLVGILSVDLPEGGRRPDEVQCALLEMYATQAGHRDRQRATGRAGAGQRGVVPPRLRERTGRHVAGGLHAGDVGPVPARQRGHVPDARAQPPRAGDAVDPRRHPPRRPRRRPGHRLAGGLR